MGNFDYTSEVIEGGVDYSSNKACLLQYFAHNAE